MRTRSKWLALALVSALAAVVAVIGVTAARAVVGNSPTRTVTVGGFAFPRLPDGLGRASNFDYRFQGVHFTSRVWESRSAEGGWRVDLAIDVLHGKRLVDGAHLREWFVRYQDREPAEARAVFVRLRGHPAWLSRDQVFWLQEPGLAVVLRVDMSRWELPTLARAAWAATKLPAPNTPHRPGHRVAVPFAR